MLSFLYTALNEHPDLQQLAPTSHGGSLTLVDSTFGLEVSEQVICAHCGKQSHIVKPRVEHFCVVTLASLALVVHDIGGPARQPASQ